MEPTVYTGEEEVYAAGSCGISVEQFRALPEIEKFHHQIYGSEMGQCAISELGRDVALASLEERREHYAYRVWELNKHALTHILLWGAGPCPQLPEMERKHDLHKAPAAGAGGHAGGVETLSPNGHPVPDNPQHDGAGSDGRVRSGAGRMPLGSR
jgi:hypothetical protein